MTRIGNRMWVWAIALTLLSGYANATVKKSRSGICHAPSSPYYASVKNFKAFDTIEDCLSTGGRLPKDASGRTIYPSEQSTPKQSSTGSTYKREYFGHGWADQDGDCQNTRHEILADMSTSPPRYDERGCRVIAGRWISPFTGEVIFDASSMDIDHVVPLSYAWRTGADAWSSEKRKRFANDPSNLLPVEASLNRQKSDSPPSEWLPPSQQCGYIARFYRIVKIYKLTLPNSETAFIEGRLQDC